MKMETKTDPPIGLYPNALAYPFPSETNIPPPPPIPATAAEFLVGRITQPEERVVAGEESEKLSSGESETLWSDTSTDSSSTEEEEEDIQQQPQQQTGGEIQLAEARAGLIVSGSDEGTSGSVSMTPSDPDVLNCPICYKPLCSPVYQLSRSIHPINRTSRHQLTPPVRGLSSLAKVRAVKNKAATTVKSKIIGRSESLLRDVTGKAIQLGAFYPCRGGSPHLALTHEDILHSNQDADSSKINSR